MNKETQPFRSYRQISRFTLLFFAAIFSLWLAPISPSHVATAYVDPALTAQSADELSVIVTGVDGETAVSAINTVGGQLTSNLWLIDAAGATINKSQLTQLASFPGVLTIVNNHGVETAGGGNPNDDNNGYITDRRISKGNYAHTDPQKAPIVALPDGGFVTVDEKGGIIIINADGSERARTKLNSGGPYYTAPQVTNSGIIYLAGEGKRVYAVNPDGSIRWTFQDAGEKFKGGVLISPNETMVYITDEKRKVYALNADSGKKLWQLKIDQVDGDIKTTPAIADNGTLFVVTEKGYLTAVDPSGNVLWRYRANGGGAYIIPPLVDTMGRVFITGEDKVVTAINTNNGSLLFKFTANSKILAQPDVSADGTLFVAAEDRTLYAINTDGSVRFTFRPTAGKFKKSPALTPDGATVIVAVEENVVYAVDTQTGILQWQYAFLGKILHAPVIDDHGNVIIGSEGGELKFLTNGGRPIYQTAVSGPVQQSPVLDHSGNVIVQAGDTQVVMLGMLPNHWDGRPDVMPTDSKKVWQVVNPTAIDIGADQLHDGFAGQSRSPAQAPPLRLLIPAFTFHMKSRLN